MMFWYYPLQLVLLSEILDGHLVLGLADEPVDVLLALTQVLGLEAHVLRLRHLARAERAEVVLVALQLFGVAAGRLDRSAAALLRPFVDLAFLQSRVIARTGSF